MMNGGTTKALGRATARLTTTYFRSGVDRGNRCKINATCTSSGQCCIHVRITSEDDFAILEAVTVFCGRGQ